MSMTKWHVRRAGWYASTGIAGLLLVLGSENVQAQSRPNAQAGSNSIVLDTIVLEGAKEGAKGIVGTEGYVAKSNRTATKSDAPVAETAQSMSTISQKQLQDIKPQNLVEALNYSAGSRGGQYGAEPRFDAFKVRGIDLTYTGIFRDGLRQISSPNGLFRLEPYGVEAITLLRGPSASIYGASSSGGIVDIISKRPTEERLREVELQYGSYGRVQGAFDFSGPLDAENTLLYRLTGVARDGRNEIDAIKDDRLYIAPAITWQPSDDTKFTVLGEYMDSTTGGTWGYINNYGPDGTSTGATPVYGGDARFNDFTQKQWRIGYELDQRLSDSVTLHHKLRYSDVSMRQEWVFEQFPGLSYEDNRGLATDTYLKTEFETGAAQHELITGVDYSYMKYTAEQGTGADPFTDDFTYVPEIDYYEAQRQRSIGIYAQDRIEYGAWRLSAGVRHDWVDSAFSPGGDTEYERDDSETTARFSLGYVTSYGIMPYVSYGTSFVANPGVIQNVGGVAQQARPTLGEQVEVGVKYAVPDTNVLLTASVFNIEQENASVYETSSGDNLLTQLDLRSRGVELEATASLDNGLSLIAAYSYNDVEITKLTPQTVGKTLNSSPYHMFSIWADYEVQSGPLEGLGVGAGIRYVGSSFGDNVNTPVLDNKARTFVDASLRYDFGKLNPSFENVRLQINATNLLNEVKQVCTSGFCYYDEGRKVIASMRYRF
ncbi:TonB-dependent siderophore receptor [Phyllobacterium sp. 0TCS1.6C]|uniref:TonB-dependent siderophore receptor n=1 Tax=unclassified Phyllobacterium TaxID=2638441 RepID=UPI0022651885|nr:MULTISPECIES: TonB-dependent siderophore receptor [unclassified Phyllobacterium]MCX8280017.1 TonB-dependent siderophore receptor [Phyllobacterium sp. 0TCS1.6C]MCX8296184.1 TonB-dependent siderophore receptor [Phyllobacterium sp. 0TCS1.6A]